MFKTLLAFAPCPFFPSQGMVAVLQRRRTSVRYQLEIIHSVLIPSEPRSFILSGPGRSGFIYHFTGLQSCKFWELWSTEIAIPCIRAAFQYEEVDKFENRKPCRPSSSHPERTPLFFSLQRRCDPFPYWKVEPEFQKKDKSILMLMRSEVKNLPPFGRKQITFQLLIFLLLSCF